MFHKNYVTNKYFSNLTKSIPKNLPQVDARLESREVLHKNHSK